MTNKTPTLEENINLLKRYIREAYPQGDALIGLVDEIATEIRDEAELREVKRHELEILALHLDRQLAGYTSVDLRSIYRYIKERKEAIDTPPTNQ